MDGSATDNDGNEASALHEAAAPHITLGSPDYRRAALAMGASGFATFALLYCVQPLMPVFVFAFGVSPAASALTLSAATGVMPFSIFACGILAERIGRKPVMLGSLFGSAALNAVSAVAPDWSALLATRLLEGVAAGGVPAVAMAWLADEIHPSGLGLAMGLYVGGNAFGGMLGRLLAGAITDWADWRVALGVLSVAGFGASLAFLLLLPPARRFRPSRSGSLAHHAAVFGHLLRARPIVLLMMFAALIVGPFVTVYNDAGFRLLAPPYGLSQTVIGLIFGVYVFGMAGSAMAGRLADRFGRAPVLIGCTVLMLAGLLATLARPVPSIVAGVALLTTGFFGAHVVASASVGRIGRDSKGHASTLYLLAFYGGMTVVGPLGGAAWQDGGWFRVAALALVLTSGALAIALVLARGGSLGHRPTPSRNPADRTGTPELRRGS